MNRDEPVFCAKRMSRTLALNSLRPVGFGLRLLQKGQPATGAAIEHKQRSLLWQVLISVLVILAVFIVSGNLNQISGWLVSGTLIAINIALLASALWARFNGQQRRSDRLFAWTTLNYVFSSVAFALQLQVIDFIPQSFLLWVWGGCVLSILGFSRAPLLLTQIALMAWMYSRFLYAQDLLPALIVITVCAVLIAWGRIWRDQFILLMLNIVILFNLTAYDFIHNTHFPLQFARDHIAWTLVAILMLGVLGGFLQLQSRLNWQELGKAGLFVAAIAYSIVLTTLSFTAPWTLILALPMLQVNAALLLLIATLLALLIVIVFNHAAQHRFITLLLTGLGISAALVVYAVCSGYQIPGMVVLLILAVASIQCSILGLQSRSNIWIATGAALVITPLILRFVVLGGDGRLPELFAVAGCLTLPLIFDHLQQQKNGIYQ